MLKKNMFSNDKDLKFYESNNFETKDYNLSLKKIFSNYKIVNEDNIKDLQENKEYFFFGRITAIRIHATVYFLTINNKIQLMINKSNPFFNNKFSYFDIIYFSGLYVKTSTDFAIQLENIYFHLPCYHALQKEYYKSSDECKLTEQRLYNSKLLENIVTRSNIVNCIRSFFLKNDFVEVETPIIQPFKSGALAKSFEVKSEYFNKTLHLRISPECFLKRLIIAGLPKVFEIGKNFRNESLSSKHYFEFTSIEFYEININASNMIKKIFNLIKHVYKKLNIEFDYKFFPEYDLLKLVNNFLQKSYMDLDEKEIKEIQKYYKLPEANKMNTLVNIFDYCIINQMKGFYFIRNFPSELTPLALSKDEFFTDSADLFFDDIELATIYSELNNPFQQNINFSKLDEQSQDKNFLNDMYYGMYPCAGAGIGIDRLVSLILNHSNIKQSLTFYLNKSIFINEENQKNK